MKYLKFLALLSMSFLAVNIAQASQKAEEIAKHLDLVSHPDGGYFKEIYRVDDGKNSMTMIYALRKKDEYSTIHKLSYPEIFQWVNGGSFHVTQISPEGKVEVIEISQTDPIHVVPAEYWFQIHTKNEFSLMSAIVTPAFSWEFFTEISYDVFIKKYPHTTDSFKKPFNHIFQKPE